MSKLTEVFLSSKNNIPINTELAVAIGLNETIVLRQVYYWVEHNKAEKKNFRDGKYWVYNSMKQWRSDNFPFMSEKTIERAFSSLRKKNLILVGDYSTDRMKRPNWYTINDKEFDKLIKKITGTDDNSDEQKEENKEAEETHEAKSLKAYRQNDCMQYDTPTDCYYIYNNINNTDSETTNRDYITETTDNSLSDDKDLQSNSPKGEQSNSFSSGKKATTTSKRKMHSEKEMEDMVNQMPLRAKKIAYEMIGNIDKANNVHDCVKYFLDKYKECTGKRHKVLKDETLTKIVFKFTDGIEIERDGYVDAYDGLASTSECVGDYRKVINEYFNTDFKYLDKETKKRIDVDYSLVHFSGDTVLTNMMNHVGKDEWCDSI